MSIVKVYVKESIEQNRITNLKSEGITKEFKAVSSWF